jgi:uncharacterized membrane protein YbaN (DUF454 family)
MSDNSYRDEYQRSRPRHSTALIKAMQSQDTPPWFAKLLALILLLLCVGLGVLGVILPLIPGLLFFAFAAMLAASLFPTFGQRMRRTPWLARVLNPYLDSAQGFVHFTWRAKVRFVLWMTVKVMVDSFVLLWTALTKLVDFVSRDKPRF